MMSLLGGLLSIATAPLRGVVKVVEDLSGSNGEENQFTSLGTIGTASILKGTIDGTIDGIEQISEE